jgi:hypothetical protein
MDSIDRFFECNAPGVIFERFEDETVVINLDSGNYYTLDAMAAALWERLNESVALGGLIAETQRDYAGDPAEIEQAVREFVGVLLSEQLVRPVVAPPPAERGSRAEADRNGAPGAGRPKGDFHAPQLGKSNDMAEMLILDPVHDVDGAGWPSAPATRSDAPTLVEDDVSEWPDLKRGR